MYIVYGICKCKCFFKRFENEVKMRIFNAFRVEKNYEIDENPNFYRWTKRNFSVKMKLGLDEFVKKYD